VAFAALTLSLFVRDTGRHVELEHEESRGYAEGRSRVVRSCSQAGLVNNMNDALAWGLIPLFLATRGASAAEIGPRASTRRCGARARSGPGTSPIGSGASP